MSARARRVVLLSTLALLSAAPLRAEITAEARGVVDRYLAAIGGIEAVRAHRTTRMVATLEAFGLKGRVEAWSEQPDRRASVTAIGPFTLREGSDGTTAWRTDPTGKLVILDGKDLEDAIAGGYFESERWLDPDQGGGTVTVVKDTSAAADQVVLEVVPPNAGRTRRFFFSTKTHLVERAVTKRDQQVIVTTFSDYRLAHGRLTAHATRQQVAGMPMNDLTLRFDTLEVNVAIDPAVFQPPREAGAEVAWLGSPGRARLPFAYRGRHIWMKASVNGQPPADFIFDTGASVTVIDSAYAAKLGLAVEGKLHAQGAGSAGSAAFSQIRSLRVEGGGDGVEMKDQRVAVLSVNPFLAPFFWREVAGIIGYDFISHFVTEIRYDDSTLTFFDPKTFTYSGKGQGVPFRLAGTVPAVKLKLDGRYEGEFRVDVGSSSTVDLHSPFVKQHGLREKFAKSAITVMGGGFGGTFENQLVRMDRAELGPFGWDRPLVGLSGVETGALASEEYQGNIGNQILERFTCTFDYDKRMLYLEPGRRYAEPDQFSRSGMQIARFGDTVRVVQLLPGSPAEKAGLREDDQVTSVNGRPIGEWESETVRFLLDRSPAGTKVEVGYLRAGKARTAKLQLANLL